MVIAAHPAHLSLASDAQAPIPTPILNALTEVNVGDHPGFEQDPWSRDVHQLFRHIFKRSDAELSFTSSGTGANILGLSTITAPGEAIICAETSHLYNDSAATVERVLGSRLIPAPTHGGKLTPKKLEPFFARKGDLHTPQIKVLSFAQPTEVGTLYTLGELRTLADFAQTKDCLIHIDGARLPLAVIGLGCSFSDITQASNCRALSLGGTKLGLLNADASICFPPLKQSLHFQRKQLLQLCSKSRYVAAQFLTLFGTNLWRELGKQALSSAQSVQIGLLQLGFEAPAFPVESNMVFVAVPPNRVKKMRKYAHFYVWDREKHLCRLVTHHGISTTKISQLMEQWQKELGLSTSIL
ncbi:MAG: beta-eliminating lyase-related protein [Myxococcota bacterium]|nr:beta-eliminating lyase-related protein [Myxococcota bacterium]